MFYFSPLSQKIFVFFVAKLPLQLLLAMALVMLMKI